MHNVMLFLGLLVYISLPIFNTITILRHMLEGIKFLYCKFFFWLFFGLFNFEVQLDENFNNINVYVITGIRKVYLNKFW